MPSSAAGVYCSHVLEHLSFLDCKAALKNTYEMLAPGGLSICVSDLKKLAIDYVNGDVDANNSMINSGLGLKYRPRGLKNLVISFFGNSNHLWLWDERQYFLSCKQSALSKLEAIWIVLILCLICWNQLNDGMVILGSNVAGKYFIFLWLKNNHDKQSTTSAAG